ncbi:hypothetical protein M406DRAFT_334735 [Cryphonectria parasitica EP155]|uniref:C3H1-type domain-containing protein n=1 Tax=Cryphonectria parasitica (strain ATCC 38755 / EP155) TaxID=660469 RepID=A0A9P4XUB6_CRYP1|nr:uncharacterized protein M406DRAFT_334735 [Cryphonectria parasitica EP155]KAF3761128.1 hypothetical protein M406DRAFT_334735 [Cryphonectria parasitica EP155]
MFPPRGIIVSDGDMDQAMSYCYDRGDGQFTRLVPVDSLPFSLRNMPARVTTDEGMIVLPVPRMRGPDGQPADSQLVPVSVVTPPASPMDNASNDIIQSRIDSIVASTPPTVAVAPVSSSAVVLARPNGPGNRGPNGPRREKIYCDKWIHDGTCAFTQQGCKFKHEMPQDKETQQSLGLFHGYPAWWKKHCADQQQIQQGEERPINVGGGYGGAVGSRFNDGAQGSSRYGGGGISAPSWRRIEAAPTTELSTATATSGPVSGSGSGSSIASSGGPVGGSHSRGRGTHSDQSDQPGRPVARFSQPTFGPIAPPAKRRQNKGGEVSKNTTPSEESDSRDCSKGGVPLNPYEALEDYGAMFNKHPDAKPNKSKSEYTTTDEDNDNDGDDASSAE